MINQEYGRLIKECNIMMQGGVEYPIFHYVSGIKEFDNHLEGKPFSETEYKLGIAWFEHAYVFYIYDSKGRLLVSFPKLDWIEVTEHKNTKIKVLDINKFIKSLRHGRLGGGGLLGGALFKAIGFASDEIDSKINSLSSKEVDGSIFEFNLKNRNNEDCIIKLSCENQYLNNAHLFLLMKNLRKPLD
jgi:hypothetical protein